MGEPDMTESATTLGKGYLDWTRYLQAFPQISRSICSEREPLSTRITRMNAVAGSLEIAGHLL